MAPKGSAYHVDWNLANNSNVHVANHRDWFTTFTEFKSELEGGAVVLGLGNVQLEVITHLNGNGTWSQREITLHEVLFVPAAICNILGGIIFEEFGGLVSYRPGGWSGLTDMKTGVSAGLFDAVMPFHKLWLVGHQKGKTSLDGNGYYSLTVTWPDNERNRWQVYKKVIDVPLTDVERKAVGKYIALQRLRDPQFQQESQQYTSAEKIWLKRTFGSENIFLAAHKLNISKDKDRLKGLRIARALIEKEAAGTCESEKDSEEDESEDDSEDEFEKLAGEDPASYAADYFFSKEQLQWIKRHFEHSGHFLAWYELKFYREEDCKEGVAIVEALMSAEEDTGQCSSQQPKPVRRGGEQMGGDNASTAYVGGLLSGMMIGPGNVNSVVRRL